MKTFNKSILSMFALATVVMASCSDNDTWNEENGPDPSKELISFSSQDGQIGTRAVFEGTRAGLHSSKNTKIVMRIKAEINNELTGFPTPTTDKDKTRYTRIVATASEEKKNNVCHSDLNKDHSDITFVEGNYRYWDDAFGRYSKLSVYAVAVPGKDDEKVLSDDILTDNSNSFSVSSINQKWFTETTENEKTKAWSLPLTQTADDIAEKDLCYSNNISKDGTGGVIRYKFTSENTWKFDNIYGGQLQWTAKSNGSTIGKFDQGNLIFKHALCKVTINLTEAVDKGFDKNSNADFKFKENTNVELLDFPYESILDLATGTWDETEPNYKKGNFTKLHETTANPSDNITVRTVTGLTLPGKILHDINDNALHFIIDDNDYYVTCNQIATAIRDHYKNKTGTEAEALKNFTTMEQGKHYVINLTIGKTKIENITAQLIGWEEVNSANIDPTNAYIKVNLKSSSSNVTNYESGKASNFHLYRSAHTADLETGIDYNDKYNQKSFYDWETNYETTAASKEWISESSPGHWETGWYWPDNKTYYHIRAVGDNTSTSPLCPNVTIDATNGDYFSIKSGNITGTDYRDYIWGAPFKQTDDKLSYSITNGFDGTESENNSDSHQIYKAIGATNDVINMLFFHMTAQVFFNITTTITDNKVALQTTDNGITTNTKVEILRFYKDGTVRLGNGCVEPVTTSTCTNAEVEFVNYTGETSETGSTIAAVSEHQYGVVPQTLKRASGTDAGRTIGLRITTPDNNQYVIEDISTVLASSVSNNNIQNPYTSTTVGTDTKFIIDRWYPGYKYTYTIRITKKGIDKITAQLLGWETVKSDNIDIDLEGK